MIGGHTNVMVEWAPDSYSPSRTFDQLPERVGPGSRAAILNNTLYSCGGHVSEAFGGSTKCFAVDMDKGSWSRVEDMKVGRFGFTLTAVGAQLVATGGTRAGLKSVEIYTIGSGWKTANWSLAAGAYRHCAVAVSDSELMVFSGQGLSTMRVTKYNIHNGARKSLDPPSTAITPSSYLCAKDGDHIYVTNNAESVYSKKTKHLVWKYDIAGNNWGKLPELKAHYWHQLAVVNGKLCSFDRDGVQVLEKGKWKLALHQPKHQLVDGAVVVHPFVV